MRIKPLPLIAGTCVALIIFSGVCFFPVYRWVSSVGLMGEPLLGNIRVEIRNDWFLAGQSGSPLGNLLTRHATRPMLVFAKTCGCLSEPPALLYVSWDENLTSAEAIQRLEKQFLASTSYSWGKVGFLRMSDNNALSSEIATVPELGLLLYTRPAESLRAALSAISAISDGTK